MSDKLFWWTFFVDLLWIPLALLLAYASRHGLERSDIWQCFQEYSPVLVVVVLLWTTLSAKKELHGFRGGWSFPTILSQVTVGLSLLMIVLLSLAFLARQYYSRLILAYFAVYLFVGFVGNRCLSRLLVRSRSRNGGKRRVVILGNGPVAKEIAAKVLSHPELMCQVIGLLYPSCLEFSRNDSVPEASVFPTIGVLDFLQRNRVQELIVTVSPVSSEIRKLLAECRKLEMRVTLVPQFYELYISRTRLVEIDGLPLLSLEESLPPPSALLLKRAIDLILAISLLLLSTPLLMFAGAALYVQKRQALSKEERGGKNGRPFWMYRLNIDRHAFNLKPYERFLARLSLTELPQLWNVIRGEMTLVGPRPESMERVRHYSDWQQQRLRMPAGVTGLAQVYGLREEHSSEEKTRFDLQYIFHWSLFGDLSLLLQTVWTLLVRLGKNDRAVPPDLVDPSPGSMLSAEVVDANRA